MVSVPKRDPLNPSMGPKRFFEGREKALLDYLSQPGATQSGAAAFFGCADRTVEKELARLRKLAKEQGVNLGIGRDS